MARGDGDSLGGRLAARLLPWAMLIGSAVGLGLPVIYYAIEAHALRQTADVYAREFAQELHELVLEAPDLWKYQTQKYFGVVTTFVPYKDVIAIEVVDDTGRPVSGFRYLAPRADAWWNRLVPAASARLLVSNRHTGMVVVRVSSGRMVAITIGLVLLSGAVGAGLAVLTFRFPVRVVRGMEAQIRASNAELTRRAGQQQSLVEASRLLASTLELREVFDRLTEIARALLGVDIVRIWLRHETTGELVLEAQAGATGRTEGQRRLVPGEGLGGFILSTAQPLALADVQADKRLSNRRWFADEGIASFLGVPLLRDGHPAGMLVCLSYRRRDWSTEEVSLTESLAVPATIAIRNAQLYAEAQARLDRMRRLTRLGQLVTSSLDLREVLDGVTESTLDLLHGDLVRLWTVDRAADVLRLAASRSRDGDADLGATATRVYPLGRGLLGWVVENRTKRYAPNMSSVGGPERNGMKTPRYISQLGVPLVVGEHVLGVLQILSTSKHRYSQEEEELLELFAGKAAASLHNAHLFAETQRQASALRDKNAQLDSFVYSVSHDLKAPLVTVHGMANVLAEDFGDALGADGRRYLDRIQANVQQMDRLIADLLALSRVGREARAPEAVDLSDVVDAVVTDLAAPMQAAGAKVVWRDLATIQAVRTQMEQVMSNLLSNAVKYRSDKAAPLVEVTTQETAEFVECAVRDNGIGIPPAYHEKVFEVFERLKEVDAEGTGVGLTIVKKIVEGAGGRIWVESEPGQGATFRFTWPKTCGRETDGAG